MIYETLTLVSFAFVLYNHFMYAYVYGPSAAFKVIVCMLLYVAGEELRIGRDEERLLYF